MTGSPPCSSRTVPMKLAIPPTSVRPRQNTANSAAGSNRSAVTRIISAAGHGREESHLVARADLGVVLGVFAVDGAADDARGATGLGEARIALAQPDLQLRYGAHA